jgi:putative ABC transport system permease protein
MTSPLPNLRLALRSLARQGGLTRVIVLTVALAAGANTAVFTLVQGILLSRLPGVVDQERLVAVSMRHSAFGIDHGDLSIADYRDLAAQCTRCQGVGVFDQRNVVLQAGEEPERISGAVVSANLFAVLGARPGRGRSFLPADGQPGAERVVLISHGLWQRRFGGDPTLLGRTVTVGGRPATVVGIMPAGFRFPETADLWLPLVPDPAEERSNRYLDGTVARLGPGVELATARAEVAAIGERLAAAHPDTNAGWSIDLAPLRQAVVDAGTRRAVLLMQGAVAFLLLIACANVANLLLAREASRRREVAVRLALGAGRWRVVGQLVAESLLLAVAGGGLGVLLARWSLDYVLGSNPEEMPYWNDFSIGWEVLAATLGLSLVAGLLFGTLPALRVSRSPLGTTLKEGGAQAGQGRRSQRLQRLLVAGEVALAVVLVFCAVLFVRTSLAVLRADGGFPTDHLLVARTFLGGERYATPKARIDFLAAAMERLGSVPGVSAVAFTGAVPTDDGGGETVVTAEAQALRPGEEQLVTYVPSTAGFFATLGVPLLAGREFTPAEEADPEADVAVLNRSLADRLWPGRDPLGRRFRLGDDDEFVWLRVVGVAGDLQYEEFGEETPQSRLQVHLPYAVAPWSNMALMLRTAGDPAAVAPAVRAAVAEADPTLALWDVRTMEEVRSYTTWGQRVLGEIFGYFGAVALLLGALGIYGVVALGVSQRRREFGVRMALGADPASLIRLVMAGGLGLTAAGLAGGLGGALGLGRLLRSLLYGVSPGDPAALAVVAAIMVAVALAATYLPARRASRVDPVAALKAE